MLSYISIDRFKFISENLITHIIPKDFHQSIDYINLSKRIFQDHHNLDYAVILDKYCEHESKLNINFIKHVILTDYCLRAFKQGEKINTLFVWRLIFEVLKFFRQDFQTAGIGSQGFLSIELYRFEKNEDRKILRLHLWSDNFDKEFEQNDYRKYKIHSHLFNAQSHVLSGSIKNNRYKILDSNNETENSLYKINWVTTENNGQTIRKSHLIKEIENIEIKKINSEVISISQEYSININEFHSSESTSQISATLFLFDSDEGLNENSKVVGPKDDKSPGFKYEEINFFPLLYEVDREIKKHYNRQVLLAQDWMRKIHTLEHAHRIESRQLKNFSEILSWSIVGLPASISALAFYLKSVPENKPEIIIWLTILGGLSTLIGTINKVLKPSDLSEKHRVNSERFEHLRHRIEQLIVFNNDERLEIELEKVRLDWQKLTLHNVKESNFLKATNWIKKLKKYPENLSFID